MASIQERLQLKRVAALDKWTTREKLCLASAVACSGDQNWMSVSRSLKMLCGSNRPADWFSQKSCAVQYGELLENVETPKRKKRNTSSSDGSGGCISSTIAETPTESILRKLTQERIAELKALIRRNQEEYAKFKEEILLVQSENLTDAQIKEMWQEIEVEKEQKLKEQQKYTQWLKERDERKIELQKAWRPVTSQHVQPTATVTSATATASSSYQQQPKLPPLNIKSEDVDTDDSLNSKAGTSPLLTSLLKSSSPAPSTSTGASTSTLISNVRVTAPTITNLLTGNTQIQQIAPSTSSNSGVQYNPVQNQPLTGPIPINTQQFQIPPTTPSKAAPTLSMLLENKNKEAAPAALVIEPTPSTSTTIKNEPIESTSQETMEISEESGDNKDEDQQLMEVFNGLIPDNIDELADILTSNNAIILNPELLEEESILENVESLIDNEQEVEEEVKENVTTVTTDEKDVKKSDKVEENELKNSLTALIDVKIKQELIDKNKDDPISTNNPDQTIKIEIINDDEKIDDKDIKIEEKEEIAKDNKISDEKEQIIIENDMNSNQQNVDNDDVQMIDLVKDSKVENIQIQPAETQDILPEFSDDSSDNTTLQALKEKITTTVASVTDRNTSSSAPNSPIADEDEHQSSPEPITVTTVEVKKEKVDEAQKEEKVDEAEKEEDILFEITIGNVSDLKNDNATSSKEIEITRIATSVEEKSIDKSPVCGQNETKDENMKNEIVIVEENPAADEVNDGDKEGKNDNEEKKPPSDDSVIVIQEDNNPTVETKKDEEIQETVDIKEESQNKSSEKSEIICKEDDVKQDKKNKSSAEKPSSSSSSNEPENTKPIPNPEIIIEPPPPVTDSVTNLKTKSDGSTATIALDNDEETPIEIIKEEVIPRTKRDYSRKKLDVNTSASNATSTTTEKKSEESTPIVEEHTIITSTPTVAVTRQSLSIKRLKEREGSESPLVDDEINDSMPRTRRRYSSTQIFDSIPNSPASSDDKEYKAWKKSILMIYNRLTIHKNASIFLRPVTEDVAPNYKQIVHRPMDLQTIKKNIESGVIRTTTEFQRDVMLMCQNAIMYNQTNNNVYNMAKEMWADTVNVIETILESVKKDSNDRSFGSNTSSKSRGRKSNRLP